MSLLHDRAAAQERDQLDPLQFAKELYAPVKEGSSYFCSNSLGLPPKSVEGMLGELFKKWAGDGVEGWFEGEGNWYEFPQRLRSLLAQVVGAYADEVTVMNSLTVNLHLLLASFYRPKGKRIKILMRMPLFPSDHYAVKSHLALRGIDPEQALLLLRPAQGRDSVTLEEIRECLEREGEEIALVLIDGVNYLTGELSDIKEIVQLAHEYGALAGCELAHAAGNVLLALHDWNVDFAYGCSYKYLCGGPGAPGWIFVHRSHHGEELPRLTGWWGVEPKMRFEMREEFIPHQGAAAMELSTPSIVAMMPLRASLEVFNEVGMKAIRQKSVQLTQYLYDLLEEALVSKKEAGFRILTPRVAERRGCQLSLHLPGYGEACLRALSQAGVICDLRRTDVIRIAPFPLYNSFEEALRVGQVIRKI